MSDLKCKTYFKAIWLNLAETISDLYGTCDHLVHVDSSSRVSNVKLIGKLNGLEFKYLNLEESEGDSCQFWN